MVMGIDPSLTGFGICLDGVVTVVGSFPIDGETRPDGLRRRIKEIVDKGLQPTPRGALHVFIEAPMLASEHSSHLYEVGWLMAKVYDWAHGRKEPTWVYEVSNGEILKFVLGKGVGTKTELALKAYKRWGMEFSNDAKHDRLFSYCIWQYGVAIRNGTWEYKPAKRRGEGKRAVQRAVRKQSAGRV